MSILVVTLWYRLAVTS